MPLPPARPVVISRQASPLVGGAARRADRGATVAARDPGGAVQLLVRGVDGADLTGGRVDQLRGALEPHRPGAVVGALLRPRRCRPRRASAAAGPATRTRREALPRSSRVLPASMSVSPRHRARRWETLVDIPPACGPGDAHCRRWTRHRHDSPTSLRDPSPGSRSTASGRLLRVMPGAPWNKGFRPLKQ